VHLHLGGHLGWYDPQKRSRLEIHLGEPTGLLSLLEQLRIPAAEIAVVTVNRQAVDLDSVSVNDGDRVELFPPIGGGDA
jgi:sulfur carrier protein ThiS